MRSFVLEIGQDRIYVSIVLVYNNRYYRDDKLTISWAENSEWVQP